MEEVKNALTVLRSGGLIVYPTDTIWGLGCDATRAEAVEKIFHIKQRDASKSLLVLADSMVRVQAYVREVPEIAWDLTALSDKPLTIVYPEARQLAPGVAAEDGSVGIRITREAFSQQLCAALRRPIVSTSANFSGQPSPACFGEIAPDLLALADYVVDYRREETAKKQASSIIKLKKNGTFVLIRK